MTTYFTIDTNVFLHFESFVNLDWPTLLGDTDLTLILTKAVIKELDDKKSVQDKHVSTRAKRSLEKLESCEEVGSFSTHKKKIDVKLYRSVVPADRFARYDLSEAAPDDRILAEFLHFKETAPEHRCLVVSSDTGMKFKTKWLGLEFFKVPESFRLQQSDGRDKELEAARKELSKIQGATPNLKVKFSDGTNRLRLPGRLISLLSDGEIEQMLEHERDAFAEELASLEGQHKGLRAAGSLRAALLPDLEAYRREWAEYLAQFPKHVRAKNHYDDALSRIFKLDLRLCNDGTKPAQHTRVLLEAPEGMVFLEANEFVPPQQPNGIHRPKAMTTFELERSKRRAMFADLDARQAEQRKSLELPSIVPLGTQKHPLWAIEGREARISVGDLANRDKRTLPTLFLKAGPQGAMHSFHIEVVAEAGLPEPFRDMLHVILDT